MSLARSMIPSLRFPEFEDEWTYVKLGQISKNISYGMNSAAVEFNGVHKYLRITDIDEVTRQFIPLPLTSPECLVDGRYRLNDADIVFARTGASVGKSYLYKKQDGEIYFAGFLIRFSIINSIPYFIYSQTFRSDYDKWVQSMSIRSGQPGINAEEYKSLKLSFPSKREQQKIADFFKAIDDKLCQLKKKKYLIEQYKKGMMQLLFTQQVSFKDDNENNYPAWEDCTAKDYFKNVSNKNHNSDLPILAVTQDKGVVKRDEIDIKIYSSEASIKSYKVVEPGDFIISLRSFQGGIELSTIKGICSPAYTILKPTQKIDSNFFKIYFKKEDFIKRLSSAVIGIRDGKQISFNAFADIQLRVPVLEEQQKIAAFINSIKQKIEIIQTQIAQTQNLKKGLLQQMFV